MSHIPRIISYRRGTLWKYFVGFTDREVRYQVIVVVVVVAVAVNAVSEIKIQQK